MLWAVDSSISFDRIPGWCGLTGRGAVSFLDRNVPLLNTIEMSPCQVVIDFAMPAWRIGQRWRATRAPEQVSRRTGQRCKVLPFCYDCSVLHQAINSNLNLHVISFFRSCKRNSFTKQKVTPGMLFRGYIWLRFAHPWRGMFALRRWSR